MALRQEKIDTIAHWLQLMGLNSIRRNKNELSVRMKSSKGILFTIYFREENSAILMESPVFKLPSGSPQQMTTFLEALLAINAAVSPTYFGLVRNSNDTYMIILKYTSESSSTTPVELVRIIEAFSRFYDNTVPTVKDLAQELGLSFTGTPTDRSLLDAVLNDISKADEQ